MFKQHDWIMKTRVAWHTVVNVVLTVLVIVGFWVALRADGQSAPKGQALFEKRCTGCHALDSDHEGPRLRGVVGRAAGSVRTFQYSDALKNAKHKWDEANLDKWLTDPESVVPD